MVSKSAKKRKHPKFVPMNFGRRGSKCVKDRWRKPRGCDNKKRQKVRYAGKMPNKGWRNPKNLRGVHPCGYKEVLISNIKQLDGVGKECAIRISATLGERKRSVILKKAKELGLKVL
ncbi:MAG: eL32 family ribosomal protein [Candidatus Micrarchaeia archaeon]